MIITVHKFVVIDKYLHSKPLVIFNCILLILYMLFTNIMRWYLLILNRNCIWFLVIQITSSLFEYWSSCKCQFFSKHILTTQTVTNKWHSVMLNAQDWNFAHLLATKFYQLKNVDSFVTSMLQEMWFDGKNG